ncbi:hypothetical protein [Actinomadura sp. 21ATH]|uniref:hypothetical protein n=1 Tax=Actinomadura sp. 21ATH TaxID=1735444 RepID=UPI0035C1EBFB
MKRIVGGRRAPARLAVLAAAAAVAPLAAGPAQAAPPKGGEVEFRYSDPEFAESGNRVTWRWTVHNRGAKAVNDLKLVHTLTPRLKVSSVSAPCRVREGAVRCDYRALRPDGEKSGVLVAELPRDAAGAVEVKGRVTWRHGTAPATDTAAPPAQSTPDAQTSPNTPNTTDTPSAPKEQTAPKQQSAPKEQAPPKGQSSPPAQAPADAGTPVSSVPSEGAATAVAPPEREEGPEPRPNLNAVTQVP